MKRKSSDEAAKISPDEAAKISPDEATKIVETLINLKREKIITEDQVREVLKKVPYYLDYLDCAKKN